MNYKHGRFKRLFAMFLVLVMLATSGNGYSIRALAQESQDATGQSETVVPESETNAPETVGETTSPGNQGTTEQSSSDTQAPTEQSQETAQSETQLQSEEQTTGDPQSPGEDGSIGQSTAQPESQSETQAQTTQQSTGETQPPADNGIMLMDAGNGSSSGFAVEVSSKVIVDGGKDYVEAGEEFQLEIQYSVPTLGADQGKEYTNPTITFSLPKYVSLATDENGKYKIDGKDFVSISELIPGSGSYMITLNGPLTQNQSRTLTIGLVTENLTTPDNTTLNFSGFTFSAYYLDSNNQSIPGSVQVGASSVRVHAKSDYEIEKSIVSRDTERDVLYVREGEYYDVTYRITVTDPDGINRLGRLGFAENGYKVEDIFPANIPQGGGAVSVSDVKIIHGDDPIDLAEGTDYTLTKDGETVTGITFLTSDTIREGDNLQQFLEVGQMTNTTYEYTVRYPYDPYTTEGTQQKITLWTMENKAELVYTLVGETDEKTKSDTAEFTIGAYEDDVPYADIKAEKKIRIGDAEYTLDENYANLYGTVKFTLFTDALCTNVAYNLDRKQMSDIEINDSGIAAFNHIRMGTYYIKETSGLTGFENAPVVKVEIKEDGSVYFDDAAQADKDKTIEMVNTAENVGILQFTKKGDDAYGHTDQPLGGVTFTLTSQDGAHTYTAVSAQSGQVVFHNIPAGKYTLKETDVPENLQEDGYTVSEKEYPVTIEGGKVNEPELDGGNVFKNESPKGLLTIKKLDSEDNANVLSGAVFQVYGPYESENAAEQAASAPDADKLAATLTTGTDGTITSGPLTQGCYVLVETKAPVNYTSGEPQVVQVTAQTTKTYEVENDPQARVRFSKLGEEDGPAGSRQELEGAVFEIYDEAGSPLYGVKDEDGNFTDVSTEANGREQITITTDLDATGRSTSPSVTLAPGTYQYKEVAAPAPYQPDNEFHQFTVESVAPQGSGEWNIDQTITVYNSLEYGQIRIEKSAADGADSPSALNGAVFGVYEKKEDAEADVDGSNALEKITTGTYVENGQEVYGIGYSTSKLDLNKTYYVKEIKAPSGYAVNPKVFEVPFSTENKIFTVECKNQRTVSIEIKKIDSELNTGLANVGFTLYAAVSDGDDGWILGNKIKEGTTDKDGKLIFGDLDPNTTYFIQETNPPTGYVGDDTLYEVTTSNDASNAYILEVKNIRKGKLLVEKTTTFNQESGTGDPLDGVPFTLYKVGNADATTPDEDGKKTEIGSTSTSNGGKASFDNLVPGDYWLVETLPEGYYADDASNTKFTKVTITPGENQAGYEDLYKDDGKYHDEITIEEIKNTAVKGKIQIQKFAANADGSADTKTPLEGVVFEIYSDKECQDEVTTLTTTSDGTALSDWLKPGTYYMKEKSSADGYVVSDQVYEIKVTADQIVTSAKDDTNLLELTNEREGGFTIEKYGAFHNTDVMERLEGAQFTVYPYLENDGKIEENSETLGLPADPDRDPVKVVDMTSSYTAAVDGLAPGYYWLRETKVPDGDWDQAQDVLIQINPDGTARYGVVDETEGFQWNGDSSANLTIEVKDYSTKPRIRFTKKVYGEETTIDGARFELYMQVEEGTADAQEVTVNSEGDTVWVVPVMEGGHIVTIDSGIAEDVDGNKLPGQAITPKLEPGHTYWLKETELTGPNNNDHYYFDPENCWTSVEIPKGAEGEEFSVEIENYRKIHLPGYKYDATNNESPLGGSLVAVFRHQDDADAMAERMNTEYNEWG